MAYREAHTSRADSRARLLRESAPLGILALCAFFLVGIPAGIEPVAVLGGAVAAVLVALMLSDLTIGLLCFGVLAFFENLPGVNGTVSGAKIAGTLVVMSWIATIAVRRSVRRGFIGAHPGASYLILVFLAWLALSLAWAKSVPDGVTALSSWSLVLLLLPMTYAAIRTRGHVLGLTVILVAGATLVALYGMVFARGDALSEGAARLTSSGLDANYLASLLVSGVVLATALACVRALPTAARVCAVGAALVGIVALIDTVSRGGMLGLGAAMVLAIVAAGRGRRVAVTGVVVLVALSVVGYYFTAASPAAQQRLVSVQNGGSGRLDIWTVGWRMVEAYPATGVGVGNFANSTIDYVFAPGSLPHSYFIVDQPKAAHNMYLEVLAEVGVIGLGLFLATIGFLLSCAARAATQFRRRGDRTMELLSRALLVSIGGILVTEFFLSDQFSKPLWIQLALCPCLLAVARRGGAGLPQLEFGRSGS